LPPNIFDFIFGTKNHFSYLNFSYWTLWPEIQFYFLSSLIYFSDKLNFKRNFIFTIFVLLLLYYGLELYEITQIKYVEKGINLFNLIKYLPYFASGAIFYIIYKNRFQSHLYLLLVFVLFCFMNIEFTKTVFIFNMIVYGLFFCFIYYPKALSILEHRIFIKIGISSYFLYLIHEYIGVVWIRNIVHFFYPYSFIAPILIMIIIIISSITYTQKTESKIGKYLNKSLLKREDV
jgi:peptidoglycan/LPS O-acetylase OafA/YrhL